jgi:hypothetical protein
VQQQYGGKIQQQGQKQQGQQQAGGQQRQQQAQGQRQQQGQGQAQQPGGKGSKPAFESSFDLVEYDAEIPDSGEAGDVPILLADPFPNFVDGDAIAAKKENVPAQPNFLYDPPKRG